MLNALSHTAGDALLFYRRSECTIKLRAQRLQMLCQRAAVNIAALLGLHQFMCDVESRHDGDAIHTLRAGVAAHFAHLAVEIRRGGD